jgi:hypothetical protein
MLWDGTDDWIYRSQAQRQRGDAPPYPEIPLLGRCWRDWIALFVYAQIITGIPESESLVQWVIEEGVNKAVRRHTFERYNMYREVDSTLDWGTGEIHNLNNYLQYIEQQIPDDPDDAKEYLLELQREGYLQSHHTTQLFETNIEN